MLYNEDQGRSQEATEKFSNLCCIFVTGGTETQSVYFKCILLVHICPQPVAVN